MMVAVLGTPAVIGVNCISGGIQFAVDFRIKAGWNGCGPAGQATRVVEFPREKIAMKAKLVASGEIEIEGERYDHDVVIEAGNVSKRTKKVSKAYRHLYGHTTSTSLCSRTGVSVSLSAMSAATDSALLW